MPSGAAKAAFFKAKDWETAKKAEYRKKLRETYKTAVGWASEPLSAELRKRCEDVQHFLCKYAWAANALEICIICTDTHHVAKKVSFAIDNREIVVAADHLSFLFDGVTHRAHLNFNDDWVVETIKFIRN